MTKITTLLFLLILIGAGVLLFKEPFKQKVGDIRPSVLSPKKEIVKIIEGEPVDIPLRIVSEYKISVFAKNLGNARDLEISPAGTLILSIPASGKVVALPDKDNDGKADDVREILKGLSKPHGLAFYQGQLFVAEETKVVRYNLDEKNLTAIKDKVLFFLPKGARHFTRTIAFDKDGRMFVSIGSSCDVCFEKHPYLASIVVSDKDGGSPRVFANGLRNAVFIKVNPKTDELWGTEMGRDFLGDDKPPDEVNIIKEGKTYGWPVCFGAKVYDNKFGQKTPNYCETTESPVYEIAAHSAPLGLEFLDNDLLVAYHGSWNRSTPVGYKVVRLKIKDGKTTGEEDFITGFLQGSEALGRPVDIALSKDGSIFISDDKAGVVYRVSKK